MFRHILRLTFLSALALWPFMTALADDATVAITITNPTDFQRQELVELDADKVLSLLGVTADTALVLQNDLGQELPCQITHDRRLLVDAAVRPKGRWTIYARRGRRCAVPSAVYGAQYKQRMDDMAWENDRCAYRVYGPALQKSGEKSFGIDVWVKNTPDLIVDQRYNGEFEAVADARRCRQAGDNDGARRALIAKSIHYDHGNGMDGYSVGPTLGCGAPALIDGDTILMPYCYTSYQILDNGPLRFSVRLDYGANSRGIVEHRIISLDKGSHFNKMCVWYDHVTTPLTFCAGIVKNGQGTLKTEGHVVAYEDPTDRPKVHGSSVYTAVFFLHHPQAAAALTPDKRNAVCTIGGYRGEKVTYYAGAAWSRYDVPDFTVWQHVIRHEMTAIQQPLRVTISRK